VRANLSAGEGNRDALDERESTASSASQVVRICFVPALFAAAVCHAEALAEEINPERQPIRSTLQLRTAVAGSGRLLVNRGHFKSRALNKN